ncbi:hypothetical protein J6590_009416 [Homalodisca vitripennis]|nr:hypothetical protein J6590_009416 [Homalodisca vitripennis]
MQFQSQSSQFHDKSNQSLRNKAVGVTSAAAPVVLKTAPIVFGLAHNRVGYPTHLRSEGRRECGGENPRGTELANGRANRGCRLNSVLHPLLNNTVEKRDTAAVR